MTTLSGREYVIDVLKNLCALTNQGKPSHCPHHVVVEVELAVREWRLVACVCEFARGIWGPTATRSKTGRQNGRHGQQSNRHKTSTIQKSPDVV